MARPFFSQHSAVRTQTTVCASPVHLLSLDSSPQRLYIYTLRAQLHANSDPAEPWSIRILRSVADLLGLFCLFLFCPSVIHLGQFTLYPPNPFFPLFPRILPFPWNLNPVQVQQAPQQ